MSEIGEKVAKTAAAEDECIYCGKKEQHDNDTKKKEPDLESVKSLPSSLGCTHPKLDSPISGKCTKANHHIIPVKQCFLKVQRLAQIALSVDYNINAKKNGIALPTVCNPYTYEGETKNFGKFKPKSIKDKIAIDVMKELGMQWHVGHHAYKLNETASSEAPDEGEINHLPYDKEVIKLLVEICINWYKEEFCQSEKDKSEKIKAQLDKVCDTVRDRLNAFKNRPKSSNPYYVSKVASKFAFRKKST